MFQKSNSAGAVEEWPKDAAQPLLSARPKPGLAQRGGSFFKRHEYLSVFLIGFAIAFVFFLPALIAGQGVFTFYGDYVVQQIPFYKHCHSMVRQGAIFWDWGTDLGSNFIGSYSFYLLGSPFFWLTLPFPNAWVPYLMAPLFFIKFGTAMLTSYLYIKRFTKNKGYAVLGAMLYAFSGFQIYNIFFNHFHDVVALFPLLLVGLEEYVQNDRKGVFAVAVFICALCNYFFFVGQVTFLFLYFLIRVAFCHSWQITLKKFLGLAFESVVGVLMSCVILLPAVIVVLDNPRVGGTLTGYSTIVYSEAQRYLNILQAFLFPAELPSRQNFFTEANIKWTSLAGWLPMFSLSGVFAYLLSKRKTWLKTIILTCTVMAFIPILNTAFYAFNNSFYARWYYMPVLMMALATTLALEDPRVDFLRGLKVTTILTVCMAAAIGFIPKDANFNLDNLSFIEAVKKVFTQGGLYEDAGRFWLWVFIALLSLLLVWVLIKQFRGTQGFVRMCAGCTAIVVVVTGICFVMIGRGISGNHDWIVNDMVKTQLKIEDDTDFYRVDFPDSFDNLGMYWNYPSLTTFHSIVPRSVMDFYPVTGTKRMVGSRPELTRYGIRGMASVKYYFLRDESADAETVLPGFTYGWSDKQVRVLVNQHFVPMGYTYDWSISRSNLEDYAEADRDKVMMHALCLSDGDAAKYADLLPKMPVGYMAGQDGYLDDCDDRAATACDSFSYNSRGFSATITPDRDNLVFFSVPYEKGWSATVNGKKAEIVQANVGFMAVKVHGGEKNTIHFSYMTPGLPAGIGLTLGGIALLVGYLLLHRYAWSKKRSVSANLGKAHPHCCGDCNYCHSDHCFNYKLRPDGKEDTKYANASAPQPPANGQPCQTACLADMAAPSPEHNPKNTSHPAAKESLNADDAEASVAYLESLFAGDAQAASPVEPDLTEEELAHLQDLMRDGEEEK